MQLTVIGFPGMANTRSHMGADWKIAGSAGQARNMPQKGAEAADFKPPAELTGSPKAKPVIRHSF